MNLLTVIVSIVVITYLALQNILGNLFSGVAMQIGQPYKIGDWIEINTESKKWLVQVQEITWRATFLSTSADEWLMIPNKTIAQSQTGFNGRDPINTRSYVSPGFALW